MFVYLYMYFMVQFVYFYMANPGSPSTQIFGHGGTHAFIRLNTINTKTI